MTAHQIRTIGRVRHQIWGAAMRARLENIGLDRRAEKMLAAFDIPA